MRLFTAVYSSIAFIFSLLLFRRVQVCVHSTEEMCWLVYKGSNTKMDQEILVLLYNESLPSHVSKCHKSTPRPHHNCKKR